MIRNSTAVLAAASVLKTTEFYCKVLGFKQRWLWGDPPSFGCVGLGKAELFFNQQPEIAARIEGHQHWFSVEDVQALHEQHRAAGAAIISPLENKPWNVREYTVRDINGYHLRFSGALEYERPKTWAEQLPPHIRIDVHLPTLEEYADLSNSVGWKVDLEPMRKSLDLSVLGVVAIDTRDNQAVGMVRATGDGRYYMIWDVIVRPAFQGQKIGRTMVARAIEELRRRGPAGAFVGLFTGKPGFYEQVGFRSDAGGMHMAL